MFHFVFEKMKKQDIPIFLSEMFDILAENMSKIAPTGNSYDEDYKIWSKCVCPVLREGKRHVILIFDENTISIISERDQIFIFLQVGTLKQKFYILDI